jgi:sporulation protein YlmC with PRC-barrel domain
MLRILLTVVLCVLAVPSLAQGYSASLQTISEMNRIQAPQNPNYERAEKILTRRILDRKSQVVGQVQDIIFRKNGGLKSIKVDFDRLYLSQPVYLNYHEFDVRTAGRAYQLSLEDKEIASVYPQMLADIETAAGPGSEDYSVQRTLNAPVTTPDGVGVGKISDILFSADGDRVEAIYIRMVQGSRNGEQVAIPVDSITLSDNGSTMTGVVSKDIAKAMSDYVLKNK